MPERNEHTSKTIASWAGRIAHMTDVQIAKLAFEKPEVIRSLAACALTQARDHAKPSTAVYVEGDSDGLASVNGRLA